ncbi:MAG: hypothetical protein LBC06_03775 [Rickettsiales bacterium]|nr:hypothetical protein [Rickettsiales bacterium]
MTITGRIQFIKDENRELIFLTIPQSQYVEFQGYRSLNTDGTVIKKWRVHFTLDSKQLCVTTPYDQQGIAIVDEEMDADSASPQLETVSIPISSVITQGNKQLHDVSKMAKELGLDDRNTDVVVELFKYPAIQNEVGEIESIEKEEEDDNLSIASSNLDEEKEPVSLQEGGDDKYPSMNSLSNYSSFSSGASNFPPSQSFTNPSFQQPNSVFGSPSPQPNSFLPPGTFSFPPATSGTGNGEFLFGNLSHFNKDMSTLQSQREEDKQSEAGYISEGKEQPELPAIEDMTLQQLQDELSQAREYIQQLKQENQGLIEELEELWEEEEKIKNDFVKEQQSRAELSVKLRSTYEQINGLNAQIKTLKQQLKDKDQEIAQLQQQPSNAKVTNLKEELAAKNTEVQQLQKKNKELEAKKQPTEQSKAPTYTAAVGFGLAAGLVAFIALERTVRLDIWVTVGIAVASALAVSGATYLALKPSTQVGETQEPQEVNVKVSANKLA